MQISQIILIFTFSIIGLFLLISIITGLKNGFLGMLTFVIMNAVSAVGAFFVTKILISKVDTFLGSLLNKITNAILVELFEASPSLKAYAVSTGTGLVTPIAFLIVYIVFELICILIAFLLNALIVHRIQNLFSKNGNNGKSFASRIIGVLMGIVTVAMFSACFFMPVAGYLNYGGDLYNSVKEAKVVTISDNIDKKVVDTVSVKNNIIYKVEFKLTNRAFRSLTVINNNDGTKSNALNEVNVLIELFPNFIDITKINFNDIENVDLSPLDNIVIDIGNSENLKSILAEIFKVGGTKWKNNETFLGINIKQQLPSEYSSSFDGILERMIETTKATVLEDIKAFSDTGKALKATAIYMSHLQNANSETSNSNLDSDMEQVLVNINEDSAELISSAITGDLIENCGIDESSAGVVANIIKTAVSEIAVLDETQKINEAKAFNDILSFSTGVDNANPDELIESVLNSQAVINSIKNVVDKTEGSESKIVLNTEQKSALATAFDNYESKEINESEQANINALKSLFKIE